MKTYVNWEDTFNRIIKYNHGGKKFVKEQLELWRKNEKHIYKVINNYFIIFVPNLYDNPNEKADEYLVVRNDYLIFKSFENKDDSINYCLDKINTESEQNTLEL